MCAVCVLCALCMLSVLCCVRCALSSVHYDHVHTFICIYIYAHTHTHTHTHTRVMCAICLFPCHYYLILWHTKQHATGRSRDTPSVLSTMYCVYIYMYIYTHRVCLCSPITNRQVNRENLSISLIHFDDIILQQIQINRRNIWLRVHLV